MQHEAMGVVIRTIIGLAGLVLVVQFMVLPTFAAEFRQRMFYIRRQMFLLVVRGYILPGEPAYVYLRNALNGFIRNAERCTFVRLLFIGAMFRGLGDEFAQRFDVALANVSDEYAREELLELKLNMERDLIRHVMITSPVAWGILAIPLLVALARAFANSVSNAQDGFRRAIRRHIVQELRNSIPTKSAEAEAEFAGIRMLVLQSEFGARKPLGSQP